MDIAIAYTLLSVALVSVVALIGIFFLSLKESNLRKVLTYLVSFAAGVLVVVAWSLTGEIVEHAGSLMKGAPWIGVGVIVVWIAFRFIPQFHHHHDAGAHAHSRLDANRVLFSDAVHNIGDGVVIVVSFAASPMLGVVSTASIVVHEMLQEISEFFVLREAGLSVRAALLSNLLASSTILIGVFGAFFLLEKFATLTVPLLGLSVGSYLVVVFNDLIPHSLSSSTERSHYLRHFAYFAVGAILMILLVMNLPHAGV